MACDEAPSCTGEIAVLSAAQTATNQNAWIAAMKTTLTGSKYAGLKLDGVYYGNDDPTTSTHADQAMLAAHPNLKVIIAPTTVGIVAAAQVVTSQNLIGKVFVTGLGTPMGMADFVKSGAAPEFALWNVTDLATWRMRSPLISSTGPSRASRATRSPSRASTAASRTPSARTASSSSVLRSSSTPRTSTST